MKHSGQAFFSRIVLELGIGFIIIMLLLKPEAEKKDIEPITPQAHFIVAALCKEPIPIHSQGTVTAYRESDLSAEVDGQIISLSKDFLSGRMVKHDEILIEIDPEPYQLALNAAKAQLAQAQLALAQEQARAEQAKADWISLNNNLDDANDLVLRKPQIALAQTNIDAALAQIRTAERRLERCSIKAPYDGMIESTHVGVGQFIRAGTSLGHIVDQSKVEIALPILNQDMAFLNIPKPNKKGDSVRIETVIGQDTHHWQGSIARLLPRVGAKNQQYICIAEIDNPFASDIPLLPDLFVNALISGKSKEHYIEIPREAVHNGSYVWIANEEQKLEKREIQIVRYNKQAISINSPGETVLVHGALTTGDKVCTTRLPVMSPGLQVKPLMQSKPAP